MADIDVKCNTCNDILDGTFVAIGPALVVDPCETCLEKERSKGYDEGYDEGKVVGENS